MFWVVWKNFPIHATSPLIFVPYRSERVCMHCKIIIFCDVNSSTMHFAFSRLSLVKVLKRSQKTRFACTSTCLKRQVREFARLNSDQTMSYIPRCFPIDYPVSFECSNFFTRERGRLFIAKRRNPYRHWYMIEWREKRLYKNLYCNQFVSLGFASLLATNRLIRHLSFFYQCKVRKLLLWPFCTTQLE